MTLLNLALTLLQGRGNHARPRECLEPLDFCTLFAFVCCPRVEVGAVRRVEVQVRPATFTRQEKVGLPPRWYPSAWLQKTPARPGAN